MRLYKRIFRIYYIDHYQPRGYAKTRRRKQNFYQDRCPKIEKSGPCYKKEWYHLLQLII